jgi:hypothetical protein
MKSFYSGKIFSAIISLFIVGSGLVSASSAYAITPTVSASVTGSGDYVQLNVSGDPNSSVVLSYLSTSSQTQMSVIGSTNSYGTITLTISTSAYNISPGSLFYLTVNNQRSNTMTWPYTTSSSTVSTNTALSLSQSSATLSIGQSAIITATNTTGGSLYLSSNSSPAVANVSLNGNQITVSAVSSGSTTFNVCSTSNQSTCASAAITVPSAAATTSVSPLTFSQNSVSISFDQTVSVSVGGGTGTYAVSSNSNSSLVQATISGSILSLHGNELSGTSIVTICSSDMSSCGIVSATVSSVTNSPISFSSGNPSILVGRSLLITVGGGTGVYYISSNSNPTVVQANLINSNLTLFGNSNGSAIVTICSTVGNCGTLPVVVNSSTNNISLVLSESSVNLSPAQTDTVFATGNGGYIISSNSNPAVASASITGTNGITISGVTAGITDVTICQTGGQCVILPVTVTNATSSAVTTNTNSGNSSASSAITLSQVLSEGQSVSLLISGGQGPYSVSSDSTGTFSSVITNGNTLNLTGLKTGLSSVNVCSASNVCVSINVIVINTSSSSAQTTSTSVSSSANTSASSYKFYGQLKIGSTGAAVVALQKRLISEGVYSGPANGNFGPLTQAAVEKYQVERGIARTGQVGYGVVGPANRAELNK